MGRHSACVSASYIRLKEIMTICFQCSDREEELMLATLYYQWYNRAYDSCSDF